MTTEENQVPELEVVAPTDESSEEQSADAGADADADAEQEGEALAAADVKEKKAKARKSKKKSKKFDKKTPKDQSEPSSGEPLELKLSDTLHRKLTQSAESEGVTAEELATELLAEGLVLRAWEIMERKSAMRASGGNQGNQSRGQGGRNQRTSSKGGGRGRSGNSGNKRQNYNSIMDDNASFLEYVRNQEKKRR